MELSQGRLSIRPLIHEDAPFLVKWLNDPRVLAFYEGRDRPHDLEMVFNRYLSKTEANGLLGCLVSWDSAPVGYVQIYPVESEELQTYGYPASLHVYGMDQFLGEPEVWNQGIGTLLVDTVADWLFNIQSADRVVMDPRADNLRAIHVYEKCGFKKIKLLPQRELHEGKYHDCWLMERLESDLDQKTKWLQWAMQIQSIAQIGLTYSKDVYDLERYESLRQISVDILENYTYVSSDKISLSFANEKGYATPKVDVRGVVFEDNKILLVREKFDGAWALPGGWADIGYSPTEVAVKEMKEESGFEVVPVKLLAVLDKKFHHHPPEPYHIYKMFIQCEIVGGNAQTGVETSDVQFFGENELPELSLERNTHNQIHLMFEYLRDPHKAAIID